MSSGEQTVLAYGLTSTGAYDKMGRTSLAVSGNVTGENVSLTTPIASMYSLSLSGVPSGETPTLAVSLVPAVTPALTIAQTSSTTLTYPLVPTGLAVEGDKYVLTGGR